MYHSQSPYVLCRQLSLFPLHIQLYLIAQHQETLLYCLQQLEIERKNKIIF
jgi:hypothetical protein